MSLSKFDKSHFWSFIQPLKINFISAFAQKHYQLRRYGVAVLAVAIALLVKLRLNPLIDQESPFLLFFAAVLVSAQYGGMGAGVLATALAALISDYFFLSPAYTFINRDLSQNLRLVLFTLEGLSISKVVASLNSAKRRTELSKLAALHHQEILRQSEESFHLLIEDVKEYAIFTLNPNGQFASWNTGAERLFGYHESEIIGKHFSCIFTPEDIQSGQPKQKLSTAVAKGRADDERWHIRKDGTTFWATSIITALRDQAGSLRGFSKVVRDITERKESQEALKKSQERLKLAQQVGKVGTFEWNIQTDEVTWTQEVETLYGLAPGSFGGKYNNWVEALHPDDRSRVDKEITRAARESTELNTEFRILWSDGSLHWIAAKAQVFNDDSGKPSRMLGVNLDITDRKQAEQVLRQRAERERLVAKLAQHNPRSSNLQQILNTIVTETRQFLCVERVFIYRFEPDWSGIVTIESVGSHWPTVLGARLKDPKFVETYVPLYRTGRVQITPDIYTAGLTQCHIDFLAQFQVKANLVVPIVQGEQLWGLLVAQQCSSPREWQPLEIDLFKQLATQVGIAIQQQELYQAEEGLRQSEERFRATFNQAAVGIAHFSPDGKWLMVNQKLCDIVGYTRRELLELTFQDITHPDELDADLDYVHRILANEIQNYSLEKRYIRNDSSHIWINLTVSLVRESSGEPKYFIAVVEDISERKQVEAEVYLLQTITQAISEANDFHSAIQVALSKVCEVTKWDYGEAWNPCPNGIALECSSAWYGSGTNLDTFRRLSQEFVFPLGTGLPGRVWLSQQPEWLCDVSSEPDTVFLRVQIAKEAGLKAALGTPIIANNQVLAVLVFFTSKFRKEDKRLVDIVPTVATQLGSVIQRKQAEDNIKASLKEKEVLLKEIHHRVKNNLQIISSLLNLQSGYIEDEQTLHILKQCENRVVSMALIHEQLYQSKDLARIDFSDYIQNLAANVFGSYEFHSNAIALKLNVDNIVLGVDAAIPCGLIINELVSNSLKYAFPLGKEGEICIELHADNNSHLTLTVKDNGIGFPKNLDFENTESLGLQIVVALTNQLGGTIELNTEVGTEFKVKF